MRSAITPSGLVALARHGIHCRRAAHGHHGHLDHQGRPAEDAGQPRLNLSWVFNAYIVALGGLLLLGDKLSDVLAARRFFSAGWVVLKDGPLLAGVASNPAAELTGRTIQGAGSALIAPAVLTLLFKLFGSSPKVLTKALAFYGAAAPAVGTAGIFLAAVTTEHIS